MKQLPLTSVKTNKTIIPESLLTGSGATQTVSVLVPAVPAETLTLHEAQTLQLKGFIFINFHLFNEEYLCYI